MDLGLLPFANGVPDEVSRGFSKAELLYSAYEVSSAIDRMAVAITATLQDQNPVVLSVLQGGLYLTGQLMARLVMPLQQGYVHVGRYADAQQGGELHWHGSAHPNLRGRTVLLVDDVLDHGVTLQKLLDWLDEQKVARAYSAVVVAKEGELMPADRPAADFVGLIGPDRFLFGCGMDVQGYGRNLPAMYALRG